MSAAPVRVIGAGVVGLACALRLQEQGHPVSVWARERTPHTTSDLAAALWYPYLVDEDPRIERWSLATLAQLFRDAREPASGVLVRQGVELFAEPPPRPYWASALPMYRPAQVDERPHSHPGSIAFTLPVAEMGVYLPWLEQRFLAGGGEFVTRSLDTLDESMAGAAIVVNATGLGARLLVPDAQLSPRRGQVMRVEQVGLERFWLHDAPDQPPTYVIPRAHDIVLGGSSEADEESCEPLEASLAAIRARCEAMVPSLRGAKERSRHAGLRPFRGVVRLQPEARAGGVVVHCYGHGGAGVTLAWGCADQVAEVIRGLM